NVRGRAYGQVQTTRGWTRQCTLPRAGSRNDVAQAFIDTRFDLGRLQATTRIGRQEIQYGQGALLNIGEQPNIRQAFDGAVLRLTTPGKHQVDLLALRPILYDRDNFDDSSDNNTRLLGLYASLNL